MRIALDLTDNFSVELGETREELIYKLDENKIDYTIPFDKTLDELDKSNRAVKETIISIKEFGIEISIHNDIVVYIKERTGKNTTIYKISDNKQCSASDIVKVIGIIADKFKVMLEHTGACVLFKPTLERALTTYIIYLIEQII